MKKYVLGPNAARKLKALLAKSDGVSRRPLMPSGVAYDLEYAAPFTVKWAASANGGEGAWIIWLPSDELLVVNGKAVDVTDGLESAGGDYPGGWYQLDLPASDDGGSVYLNIHIPFGDDSESESGAGVDPSQEHDDDILVEFSGEKLEPDDGEMVIPVLIAEWNGRMVKQVVDSAIVINGCSVDFVSIDRVTRDGAADPLAIQVKNFDNDKSDGGQGLAERLEVKVEGSGDAASYKIVTKSDDSKVHLIARVNGRIKYIPLTGREEKDPDEENPLPDPEDCSHPGDADNAGGVSPDDKEPGGSSGNPVDGGVRPSDDLHPGDDNCNC